ncbi:hypothetical protein GCM10017673_39030 [Streptosporangium violaceochromogenes]|nr:hypothetical protein GCM10017673_39030 [Streptosporangium violaceochromogenes]
MPEPTYTLDEARAELGRRECRAHGHDYEHVGAPRTDTGERDLAGVVCPQCGRSWPIAAPGQQPADAEQVRAEERAAIARILCGRIERGEHV